MCTGVGEAVLIASLVASVAAAGATTYSTIQTNKSNAKQAEDQAEFQNQQLSQQNRQIEEERNLLKLQASEAENERRRRFRIERSSRLASLGVMGGMDLSFMQGELPSAESITEDDIATIRLNLATQQSRLVGQLSTNTALAGFNTQAAKTVGANARRGNVTAGFQFASSVLGAGSDYYQARELYKQPKPTPTP